MEYINYNPAIDEFDTYDVSYKFTPGEKYARLGDPNGQAELEITSIEFEGEELLNTLSSETISEIENACFEDVRKGIEYY